MAKKVEFVLKQGTYEKKRFGANQPGLDLSRATMDTLKDKNLAVTEDCCTYFPTIPVVTEEGTADIPPLGLALVYDEGNDEYDLVYMDSAGTEYRAVAVLPLAP